ncbi:MAG: hypothetical protein MR911_01435 [Spirochaetia bacterium]|nr:hypothetical protein [Spirochaetia bacterium]
MKFIFVILFSSIFIIPGISCEYNPKTHELKECKTYLENTDETLDACKSAHIEYNKYVALKLAGKAKEKAGRIGNSITKFIGEKMSEGENKNVENNSSKEL